MGNVSLSNSSAVFRIDRQFGSPQAKIPSRLVLRSGPTVSRESSLVVDKVFTRDGEAIAFLRRHGERDRPRQG